MSWNMFRRSTWGRALRDLQTLPDGRLPHSLAARLIAGWGDCERPVTPEFLSQCYATAWRATGTILELGCGVTTIVLSVGAASRPASIVSLATQRERRKRVQRQIDRLKLRNVSLRATPLKSYGDFEWYDVDDRSLRRPIAAVICLDAIQGRQDEHLRRLFGGTVPRDCPVLTATENRTDS
jgi:hypothetical protein